MNIRGWSLALACAVLSFLIVQLLSQSNNIAPPPVIDSINQINQFDPNNQNNSTDQITQNNSINQMWSENISELEQIAALKIQAGLTALEGPGVTVEMDDSTKTAKAGENPNLYVIHDDDVLRVINELRAAGAEAIAINGQRLVDTSEIRCAGPTLSVNNVRSAAPFIISAIGDKTALENSIKMRGGVEQTLGVWGIHVDVKPADNVYIPPFNGSRRFAFARPVIEKTVDAAK